MKVAALVIELATTAAVKKNEAQADFPFEAPLPGRGLLQSL